MEFDELPKAKQDETLERVAKAYAEGFLEDAESFVYLVNTMERVGQNISNTFHRLSQVAPTEVSEDAILDATVTTMIEKGPEPNTIGDPWQECEICEGEGKYEGLNTVEDPCDGCGGEGYEFSLPPDATLAAADGEITVHNWQSDPSIDEMKDHFDLIERANSMVCDD